MPNDPIKKAVVKRMREKGRGHFIINCGPWIHPLNEVLNCYAILFDGFIVYKFEAVNQGWKVAQIDDISYLDLNVNIGDVLSTNELIQKIQNAHITESEKTMVALQKKVESALTKR